MIRRIPVVGRMEELFQAYGVIRDPQFVPKRVRWAVWVSLPGTLIIGFLLYRIAPLALWLYVPAAAFATSLAAFFVHRHSLEQIIVAAVAMEAELPAHLQRVLGQSFRNLCATLPGVDGDTMQLALYGIDDGEVYVARVDDPIELESVPPEDVRVTTGRAEKNGVVRDVDLILVKGLCDKPEQAVRLQVEPGWRWLEEAGTLEVDDPDEQEN